MTRSGKHGWTRRAALAALAAAAAAPALPAPAEVPALPAMAEAPALPPELARICAAATASPLPARLGAAAAEGRDLSGVAASLRARLGPGAATDWRGALIAAARRDLALGDTVEILGRPLMRTEAEVLAAGVLLRGVAATA